MIFWAKVSVSYEKEGTLCLGSSYFFYYNSLSFAFLASNSAFLRFKSDIYFNKRIFSYN